MGDINSTESVVFAPDEKDRTLYTAQFIRLHSCVGSCAPRRKCSAHETEPGPLESWAPHKVEGAIDDDIGPVRTDIWVVAKERRRFAYGLS